MPGAFSLDTSSGCGTQRMLRALSNTRILLAAAPTATSCFRHWRRSLLLQAIPSPALLPAAAGSHPSGRSSEKLPTRRQGWQTGNRHSEKTVRSGCRHLRKKRFSWKLLGKAHEFCNAAQGGAPGVPREMITLRSAPRGLSVPCTRPQCPLHRRWRLQGPRRPRRCP